MRVFEDFVNEFTEIAGFRFGFKSKNNDSNKSDDYIDYLG